MMRWIGWLMFALVGFGWMACEIPSDTTHSPSATPVSTASAGWRQSADGRHWAVPCRQSVSPPRSLPHPVVVGLLQLLLSATALVAFSRSPDHWA